MQLLHDCSPTSLLPMYHLVETLQDIHHPIGMYLSMHHQIAVLVRRSACETSLAIPLSCCIPLACATLGAAMAPGLVLCDSLASMRQSPEGTRTQHTDYEGRLFGQYGISARVVIQDGLRFLPRGRSSPLGTYSALLDWRSWSEGRYFEGYDFVMIVSGGNDVYGENAEVTPDLYNALQVTARRASHLCGYHWSHVPAGRVIIIFGGSAATWRYPKAYGALFDGRVQQVLRWGKDNLKGVTLVSGAAELATLEDHEVVDRIGHLKYHAGFDKLLAAMHQWYVILQRDKPDEPLYTRLFQRRSRL